MTRHANERRPDDPEAHTVWHDPSDEEPLSTAVVLAVAEAADLDAHEIQDPLYEVIDPDALDELFRPADGPASRCEVSFSLAGYHVTVIADGTIIVRPDVRS